MINFSRFMTYANLLGHLLCILICQRHVAYATHLVQLIFQMLDAFELIQFCHEAKLKSLRNNLEKRMHTRIMMTLRIDR